jgi:transcriptional regulator with XRE-family HTH domain
VKSIVRNLAVEMTLRQRAMGRRIAELRERAHLTQEAAADKAGVTLRAYQKWEAGGGIQYANLQKLADVFSVPVDRITGEEATPDPFQTASQLDRIEKTLETASVERQDLVAHLAARIAEQNQLLSRQSKIIEGIERLLSRQSAVLESIEKTVAVLQDVKYVERVAAAAVRSLPEWPAGPAQTAVPAQEEQQATGTTGRMRPRGPDRRRKNA